VDGDTIGNCSDVVDVDVAAAICRCCLVRLLAMTMSEKAEICVTTCDNSRNAINPNSLVQRLILYSEVEEHIGLACFVFILLVVIVGNLICYNII
jgi:hypothetical protein